MWIFEIIYYDIRLKEYKYNAYYLIFGLKLIGYAIIIFGNLLLNEIIELKCCEMNRYYGKIVNLRKISRWS